MKNVFSKIVFVMAFLCVANTFSQSISGTVTSDTGPLPGVNIVLKGSSIGTTTDFNGSFNIKASTADTLVFTYMGFVTKEVVIKEQSLLNVFMKEDSQALDEIVILGFGQTQNKRTVSTAVSTVSSKKIAELPIARPESALQGTSPGITVTQNSGAPGAPLTIRLRGAATPGNSQPLFLVDGTQVPDISFVNPSDIKSITTLKDAASSAIYGSRGGNGVILVTTKKGNKNADKITVSIDGYTGFQNRQNIPNLMNTEQYVQYYNEYQTSVGGTIINTADISNLPNTNWYDTVFDDNPLKSFINASVGGGTEKSSYFFSGSAFDQEGLIGGKSGKSGYDRKTLNFNFNTDLRDNLRLKLGANLVKIKQNRLPGENDDSVGAGNPFNQLGVLLPVFPVLDADGNYYDVSAQNGPNSVNGIAIPGVNGPFNPLLAIDYSTIEDISNNKHLNAGIEWDIVNDLTLAVSYGYYENRTTSKAFQEAYDLRNGTVPNGIASVGNTANNQLDESYFDNRFTQFDANVKYDVTNLGENHNLEVLLGTSILEQTNKFSSRTGRGLSKNAFSDVNFGLVGDQSSIIPIAPDASSDAALLSFYGRASYNFKEKYLLTATLRSDSSSRFGNENNTGYFPSFSAGWVLSEEDFLVNSNFFNLLKLRASWGINGADNISNDQYRLVFNNTSNSVIGGGSTTGFSQSFLPNNAVKWEEITQTNIGLDINALNNALGITLDYYNKKASDVLLPVGVPAFIGFPAAFKNIGETVNKGFEALISYKKTYDSGFGWNAAFNIGFNENEVTNLAGVRPLTDGQTLVFTDDITITKEGEAIASFYGFKVSEIDANGKLVFDDMVDGVAGLTDDDKTIIGSAFPDYTYGFNLGMNYKGFDLNGFLYGSEGNDIYDATVRSDFAFSNRPASYLTNGVENVLGNTAGSNLTRVSDFYVKDGSFLRLRTLTLGYSLPVSAIKKLGLSKARFYVTGENLFVSTDYDGADPEIGQASTGSSLDMGIDRGFFPSSKAFLFGFQFKF